MLYVIIKQKYSAKTWFPGTVLWHIFDFLSLKNYVNVPSKRNKQKNFSLYFVVDNISVFIRKALNAFPSAVLVICTLISIPDPCLWLIDPDSDSGPAIFVIDLQNASKKQIF